MGRITDAVVVGARTVRRLPMPGRVYTQGLAGARRALPPSGVQKTHAVDVEMIDRTRTVWLDRHLAENGVIIHLHGGAFVSGPFVGDWQWLSQQADARQCAGLMVDYRLAPDHQHPVALEDCAAVIRELAERGVLTDAPWILSGHNAGGGLVLSLAALARHGQELSDDGGRIPVPAGLVAMAPWLDLSLDNTTMTETGRRDPVHERRMLRAAARAYAGRTPLDAPDLSPINTDLTGLPPLHLSVGTHDIFLTDARIARLQLEEDGLEVHYREVGGRIGVLARLGSGEDIKRLLREQAEFIRTVFARS